MRFQGQGHFLTWPKVIYILKLKLVFLRNHLTFFIKFSMKMIFCLNLCIYMDKSLVVFWKSFLVLLRFLVKNAKNNIFEDKCFLSKMF